MEHWTQDYITKLRNMYLKRAIACAEHMKLSSANPIVTMQLKYYGEEKEILIVSSSLKAFRELGEVKPNSGEHWLPEIVTKLITIGEPHSVKFTEGRGYETILFYCGPSSVAYSCKVGAMQKFKEMIGRGS